MINKFFFSLLAIMAIGSKTLMYAEDYYEEYNIRYEDHVYKEGIKTAMLHREGFEQSIALLNLNEKKRLLLSFDELDKPLGDFYFTYIHCDANWGPSDLMPGEYINGIPYDQVTDFEASRNPLQSYFHYQISFPNENMRFNISGNYIILVYENADMANLVLSKRFMVTEDLVSINAVVRRATSVNDRFYKHEIDFSILSTDYEITNPYQDLNVVLTQNHYWYNALTDVKPTFVKDRELVYSYDENVFNALNEYRFFACRSYTYKSERTQEIIKEGDRYHYKLFPDKKRTYLAYLDKPDINGRRDIKTDLRGSDGGVDADYVWVHFTMPYNQYFSNGDIYVLGDFCSWNTSKENRMTWNDEKKAYEAALYLKQGYYNYMYALYEDGAAYPDVGAVEGNHAETENEYGILVYHRSFGASFDRLIGFQSVNSRKMSNSTD